MSLRDELKKVLNERFLGIHPMKPNLASKHPYLVKEEENEDGDNDDVDLDMGLDDVEPSDDMEGSADELDSETDQETEDDMEGDADFGGGDSDFGGGSGGFGGEGGSSTDDDTEGEDDIPADDEVEPDDIEIEEPVIDDNQKVEEMFSDTGNPEYDWSLTNPNNVRLAKFKFVNADIDFDGMMTEADKQSGVSEREMLDRLTPLQRKEYYDQIYNVRQEFPAIPEREKNIIIFNSNVPMYKMEEGEEVELEEADIASAHKRIDDYMTKRFGDHWQDDDKAIIFLQEVKVNFSVDNSIQPRLMNYETLEDNLFNETVAFDYLFVQSPDSVNDYVKDFHDVDEWKGSSVFQALVAAYNDNPSTNNSVFMTIGGPIEGQEEETDGEELADEDLEAEDIASDEEPAEDETEETDEEPIEDAGEELTESKDNGKPSKGDQSKVDAIINNKKLPKTAEKGKAYVIHWAGGRGIFALKKKSQIKKWLKDVGSWAEIVSIKYQEPEHKGKKLRVKNKG